MSAATQSTVRTVVRRVAPEVDAIDQDPVDAAALAEVMYPHIEQAAEVCAEEADRFLIEGFELAPSYPMRLPAALGRTEVRGASLGMAPSRLRISPVTGDRSRSPKANSHPRRCASLPAGSGSAAHSCASSAPACACRTWTLERRALRRCWPRLAACSWPR